MFLNFYTNFRKSEAAFYDYAHTFSNIFFGVFYL